MFNTVKPYCTEFLRLRVLTVNYCLALNTALILRFSCSIMHSMLNGMVVQSCSKLCVVDYLASISGSLLWMKSCIHWCSEERSKKSWKDFWYRSSSLTKLLREDAMAHNLPKKKKKVLFQVSINMLAVIYKQ